MKFSLSDNFIEQYKRKRAPFGFNGLGELVYMRTYSRLKEDGKITISDLLGLKVLVGSPSRNL